MHIFTIHVKMSRSRRTEGKEESGTLDFLRSSCVEIISSIQHMHMRFFPSGGESDKLEREREQENKREECKRRLGNNTKRNKQLFQ